MIRYRIARFVAAILFLTIALPATADACAVCFGDVDAPAAKGAKMAVLMLMGITGAVLSGFAGFFLNLRRRAREFSERQAGLKVKQGA